MVVGIDNMMIYRIYTSSKGRATEYSVPLKHAPCLVLVESWGASIVLCGREVVERTRCARIYIPVLGVNDPLVIQGWISRR